METEKKNAMETEKKDEAAAGEPARKQAGQGEEPVEITLPMTAPGEDQDVFVSVNGENVRIRRGERVRVKRKFLEVLENAEKQERAAWRQAEEFRKQSDKPLYSR